LQICAAAKVLSEARVEDGRDPAIGNVNRLTSLTREGDDEALFSGSAT